MDTLKEYFEVNEGIENRIYKDIFTSEFLHELQLAIKSKRYTLIKINTNGYRIYGKRCNIGSRRIFR
ncbi:hypothetical protein D1N53_22240, partial [Clostridioides difficile]